jgi:tryptophanyl-tRNA synthetase
MTQFKDKSVKFSKANGTSSIPTGLLVYPPLMAADILLYDADFVPVGIDQKQHVELTRNLAERFNNKYGKVFKIPSPKILKESAKIFDLQNPTKKMSKSSANQNGVLYLNDSPEAITKKIKTALTDNFNCVKYDIEKQPAISNLITIYSILTGLSFSQIEKKFKNIKNYGEFKNDLIKVALEWFGNFNKNFIKAEKNYSTLFKIVSDNAKKCQKIAGKKVETVYKKIGLL